MNLEPTPWIETIMGGFAMYGAMWIIVFFLLYVNHLVRTVDEQDKDK